MKNTVRLVTEDGTEKKLGVIKMDCVHSSLFPSPSGTVMLIGSAIQEDCVQVHVCSICMALVMKMVTTIVQGRFTVIRSDGKDLSEELKRAQEEHLRDCPECAAEEKAYQAKAEAAKAEKPQ